MIARKLGQSSPRIAPPGGSPLVIVAIGAREVHGSEPLAGSVMRRVEPRIRHLIRLTDPNLRVPDYVCSWEERDEAIGEAIQRCRRVVLLAEIRGAGAPGTVSAWHHRTIKTSDALSAPNQRLSAVQLSSFSSAQGLYHLPLWLEDDLPPEGVDFVGITARSVQSLAERKRALPLAVSAVTSLIWRVVRETGADVEARDAA
jgi:hypothetical protein